VFLTGRFFGRKTQKGPNKNMKIGAAGQICGRIFPERAEKGPNS
jgi:hypothetical protein